MPAILWTALVLAASSGWLAGEHTGGALEDIVAALFGRVSPEHLLIIHFFLRKLAHLTEYGILAWLLYRARGLTSSVWNVTWAKFALAGVLVIAVLDELHQHFVPSRVGSPLDVLIDLVGGVLALLLVRKLSYNRRHKIPAAANTTS